MSWTDERQSPEPDALRRVKAAPACLSQWQLSRWAMQQISAEERRLLGAHLQTCADCQARAQHEAAAFAAAQNAALPASLQRPPARARFGLAAWGALGTVLCTLLAVALWQASPPPSTPDILLKGEATLQVAVRRDGVVREGTWQDLSAVQPGDQVRLKAPSGGSTWQRLTVRRDTTWVSLFAGPVPANDWLPLGLTVNQAAPSTLRLLVCPAPPVPLPADDSLPPGCAVYDARL